MAIKTPSDRSLLRELTIILIVKLALLFFIWHTFFDDDISPPSLPEIADTLFSGVKGDGI